MIFWKLDARARTILYVHMDRMAWSFEMPDFSNLLLLSFFTLSLLLEAGHVVIIDHRSTHP